jgi:hypothetical protein
MSANNVADIADGSKCVRIRLNKCFRFAIELGHCLMHSALRIFANCRPQRLFRVRGHLM